MNTFTLLATNLYIDECVFVHIYPVSTIVFVLIMLILVIGGTNYGFKKKGV